MSIKTDFVQDRETKNTVKFDEQSAEAPIIGALYIQKHALRKLGYTPEDSITVTIEVRKEEGKCLG